MPFPDRNEEISPCNFSINLRILKKSKCIIPTGINPHLPNKKSTNLMRMLSLHVAINIMCFTKDVKIVL